MANDRNQNPANSNETGGRESQRQPGEDQHTQGSSPQSGSEGQQSQQGQQGQQGSDDSIDQNQQQDRSGFDQGNFGQGQGPDNAQGGAGNHSSQTDITSGSYDDQGAFGGERNETGIDDTGISDEGDGEDDRLDDGERLERQIREFDKGPDEYRQNRQDEFKPDVDGKDRDGDSEGPTTADGSSISSSSSDQGNGTSGSPSN